MAVAHGQAISSEEVERTLSRQLTPQTFASLSNAVAWSAAGRWIESVPSFTERVNVKDKGIDAELAIGLPNDGNYTSPLLGPGANVLQYKQRNMFARDRDKVFWTLISGVKGAAADVVVRTGKKLDRYVLFTNIDLSHEQKEKLRQSIVDGYEKPETLHVEIVGAAELAACLNQFPHLRSAYFATERFSTWQEAMRRHITTKAFGATVKLVGRADELTELRTAIDDPNIRVIVLSGPQNIGKSRLALEATAHRPLQTVVALDPQSTGASDLAGLVTPGCETVVVVEDPDAEHAEEMARYAIGTTDLKLVITLPTAESAPEPNFGRDPRVKLMRVRPLTDSASDELLRAVQAKLDFGVEAWIVDQSGGNPGVLLAAARIGPELRQTAGAFAEAVAETFIRRIRRELGERAIETLAVLSLFSHAGVRGGAEKELELLSSLFGDGLTGNVVVEMVPRLEQAGVVRLAGAYAEVVPPLLANKLASSRLRGRAARLYELFAGLSTGGRSRLIRRLRTVRGEEVEGFWRELLGPGGPLANLRNALKSPQLLRLIAGTVPGKAAEVVEKGLAAMTFDERLKIVDTPRRDLMWTLEELLFRRQTSLRALRSLALLAEAETETIGNNATGVFAESFQWAHPQLPLTLEARLGVLRQYLAEATPVRRRLVALKAIEKALQQFAAITLRRGTGPEPLDRRPEMTYGEIWDYLESLLDLLMVAARSDDEAVSKAAREALPQALQTVAVEAPPDRALARMKQVVGWVLDEKIPLPIAKLIGTLRFVHRRFSEDKRKNEDSEDGKLLRAVIGEIESLIGRFDRGDFATRLKRWAGPWVWGDHGDEEGGQNRNRWDEELKRLADEAVRNPELVTIDVLAWLLSGEAKKAYRFFTWLGTVDTGRVWLKQIEELGRDERGVGPFSSYFGGLGAVDRDYASRRLDELVEEGRVTGMAIVAATSSVPADGAAVRRTARLIQEGRVDPTAAEAMLSAGGWIRVLTPDEYLRLLRAIAGRELKHAAAVIDFLGMWLHVDRPLEGALADFAWQCLESAPPVTPSDEYDFDRLAAKLAETDLERAFRLLEQLLALPRERGNWRPTERYREGMFWRLLRSADRARALRVVLGLAARDPNVRHDITWDLRDSIDQREDAEVLIALVMEGEEQAMLVSEIITTANPGFWPIALEIVRRYPDNEEIFGTLAGGIEQIGHMIQGPWSAHLERCRKEVRSVLDQPQTPVAARRWLEKVEASLRETAERQLLAEANEEAQGLRRIVEDPAAPERLWAIRALVRSGQLDRLERLINPRELVKLLPKLELSGEETRRLQSALGLAAPRRSARKSKGKTGLRGQARTDSGRRGGEHGETSASESTARREDD